MRRLFGLLLVLILVLNACNGDDETDSNDVPSTPLPTPTQEVVSEPFDFGVGDDEQVTVAEQSIAPGDGILQINVTMPEGYKFNDQAPFRATLTTSNQNISISEEWAAYEQILPTMPLEIPVSLSAGTGTVLADLDIYWCEAINETLCFVDKVQITIPLNVTPNSTSTSAQAEIGLVPPEL